MRRSNLDWNANISSMRCNVYGVIDVQESIMPMLYSDFGILDLRCKEIKCCHIFCYNLAKYI